MVGEHIRTRREGRWAHAIDCGDETVIHLAEDAPGAALVRRTYRPAFVSGAEAVEIVTHRQRTFPAHEIVARAYSRIADAGLAAMFRDSEAFAEWCATGRLPAGPANVAVGIPAVRAATQAQEAASTGPRVEARPAASAPAAAKRTRPAAKPSRKPKRRAAKGRSAARTRAGRKATAPARKKVAKVPKRAKRRAKAKR